MKAVDVIVPTYNGAELLRHCLMHLARSTYTDFRLTVFDDGSSEDIRSVVDEFSPEATVIRSEHNRGLAYGVNAAIATGCSKYVAILNNDVEVSPAWLMEIVATAERHPNCGSVASKIRLFNDRSRLHSAGDGYSLRGVATNRGVWLEDTAQFDTESEVFAACGAAALYRRAALHTVMLANGQVFDERLFMYYEDVDLAWRLQRAGLPCVFAHNAVVYHRLSATGGGPLASYHVARNALLVLRRAVPREFVLPNRSRILAHHAGRVFVTLPHLREPAARATLRGTLAGVVGALWDRGGAPALRDAEIARISALLADGRARRCHGVPAARLSRALAGFGRNAASPCHPECPRSGD